ncbi:MAG TPA: hypothetical protein VN628_14495 [Vicinamibacterales bacterium]|nr:hypothetical protein [Vicinamibacterales bacterium]
MRARLRNVRAALAGLAAAVAIALASAHAGAAPTLPSRLSDQEFWKLVTDLSETGGSFRSENLLSNEMRLQYVIPDLMRTVHGGAYLGVGPEQNFTYIAAVQPSIAFIVDIRRGNLLLQLMYKALFELSNDRVEFVSRLFSRRAPEGLAASASVTQLFDAIDASEPSEMLYDRTLKAIDAQLVMKHGFALSAEDLGGIEHVFHAFYTFGPAINYSSSENEPPTTTGNYRPTYAELMTATDSDGHERSYLASEAAFAQVKAMQTKNLVVPVVGDFAGSRALRAVGAYLRSHSATVSAFYVSNVEQYLRVERNWGSFCGNAARLPIDESSMFIRAGRGGRYARGGTALTHELTQMTADLDGCDRRP